MELLVEQYNAEENRIITEVDAKTKDIWLNGTVMQCNIKNRNGRIYQLSEMVEAVMLANKQIAEYGGIFGEADHPSGLNINFDRISHVIKEMKISENNVSGKLMLLDTPMGRIAKELAKSGVRYGVSSRGTGSVRDDGIVEGFAFVTVDLVINPSAPGAMPVPVYESLQTKLGEKILTLSEQVREDPAAQKFLVNEVQKFLATLNPKKG